MLSDMNVTVAMSLRKADQEIIRDLLKIHNYVKILTLLLISCVQPCMFTDLEINLLFLTFIRNFLTVF